MNITSHDCRQHRRIIANPHPPRRLRRCPGCSGERAAAAVLCLKCWRAVPPEISQWLGRGETLEARVAAVRRILGWVRDNISQEGRRHE